MIVENREAFPFDLPEHNAMGSGGEFCPVNGQSVDHERINTGDWKETASGLLWVGAGAYLVYKGVTSDDLVTGMILFGIGAAAMWRGQKLIRHKH